MFDLTMNYLSRLRATIAIIAIIVVANIFDIYHDLLEGSSMTHIIEESIMVLIFFSIIGVLLKKLSKSVKKLETLDEELKSIKRLHEQQSEEMRRARANYSEVIRQQFNKWQLSQSEFEIGYLLLKGLSLKEIASVRNVKEKTTRQQASNIYTKSGVAGRHEFAGWFFEDIQVSQ